MSRNEKLILGIFSGFAFSYAVSSVFVNMYLYRYLDGMAALTVFNLFQFTIMPLGFYVAGHLVNVIGKKWTLIAGLLGFIVFYALLLVLGERSASYLYLLGSVNGLANGFFWYSFNILITHITQESTRGRFFAWFGALGSVASALAPMVSTLLLGISPTLETGYFRLFGFVVAVSVAIGAAALALRVEERPERFRVLDKLLPGKEDGWRFAILVNLVYGVREGANWSILSVLVLKAAGNDVRAGTLSIVFALVGTAANVLGGRFFGPRRSLAFWGWGSLAALGASVLLVALPTPVGAAIAGSVWRAAEALVILPLNVALYGVLSAYEKKEGGIAGRNIAMETVLNLGRTLGSLAFLLLSYATPFYAEILFPVVSLAFPVSFLIYRRFSISARSILSEQS